MARMKDKRFHFQLGTSPDFLTGSKCSNEAVKCKDITKTARLEAATAVHLTQLQPVLGMGWNTLSNMTSSQVDLVGWLIEF